MSAPSSAELVCRLATDDDWPSIWPIFSTIVAAGDTYMYAPDIDEPDARRAWMPDDPRVRTHVATVDGIVRATAVLRPNHGGPGDHVANAGWMVDPAASGRGLGRRLADHVLRDAVEQGYTGMQFNAVVSTNDRAVGLWQSLGFEIVGTVPAAFRHPVHGEVAIHVMYRDLRGL